MADRSIKVVLKAEVEDFRRELSKGAKSLDDLVKASGDAAGIADTNLGRLAQSARLQSEQWETAGRSMMGMGAAAVAGVGLAVREFARFDQAMSGVASTGDDAKGNIDALRESAIQLGADTAFSATEAAQGIEELARAGVSAGDILDGGLSGALDLAAAGAISVADAAGVASTAMTQFKLSGKDVPHVADLLAAGAGKAMGGVDDLGMALKQSGLVASQFGLSIEETTGGLSAFASAGLLGSDAGTSMKSMLLALANPSKESARLMDSLGISAYDTGGKFVGLEGLAGQLQDRMGGLDDATRQAALAQIFGTDAIRSASILYEEGASGVRAWTEAVDDSGYAAETAATMQDNLIGDLEKLGGAWSSLAISMGAGVDGPLRSTVQGVTDLVDVLGMLPDSVTGGLAALGGMAGVAALAGGALVTMVPRVMQTVQAFRALSVAMPGVTAAAGPLGIAAAGVGLLIGTIAGDIAEYTADVGNYADMIAEYGTVLNEAGRQRMSGDLEEGGYLELADKLGISLSVVTDAALGSQDAIDSVGASIQAALDGTQQRIVELQTAQRDLGVLDTPEKQSTYDDLASQIQVLTDAKDEHQRISDQLSGRLGVENDKMDEAAKVADRRARAESLAAGSVADRATAEELAARSLALHSGAWDQAAASSAVAAAASEVLHLRTLDVGTSASMSAEQAKAYAETVEKTSKSLADAVVQAQAYGNALLALSGSQIGMEAAIDAATESLEKHGATLDKDTEAGRANQQSLDTLAASGQAVIATMAEQNATNEEMIAGTAKAKQAFIDTAIAMGMPKTKAEELAESYFAIPSDVQTWLSTQGLEVAESELDRWETALDGLSEEEKTKFLAELDGASAAKVESELEWLARAREMNIAVRYRTANLPPAARDRLDANMANGGYVGGYGADIAVNNHLAGGGQAIRPSGLLNGPGTAVSDSILAWLSTKEFVTNADATSYYGTDIMYALNAKQIPREAFSSWGFAGGGTPAGIAPAPAPMLARGGGGSTQITQHITQQLSFPGVNDVAVIVDVVKRHADLSAQTAGDYR